MYSDDESFIAIEFNTKGEVFHAVPAVPANPTADDWYDCGGVSGNSKFSFTLPTTDVDGNPIDPEKLSYSIYVDGELFTFDAAHYTNDIEEDLTEIPYSIYKNAWDFYKGAVYFYRTNEGDNPLFTSRIGIQVHYTGGWREELVGNRLFVSLPCRCCQFCQQQGQQRPCGREC